MEELNDAQARAVAITDGPVLVVAGAGTGKTRVIVERIARLIHSGVPPQQILALTFTEKAAGEMLDRIGDTRGALTADVMVATYNGFGNDILQAYGTEIGLGAQQLLSETGQLVFLREHLDEFELDYFSPVSRPDSQLAVLAAYVSQLKQQLVQPSRYRQYAKNMAANNPEEALEKQKHQELAAFFDAYIGLCRQNQVIDYDDQLYLTIELLQLRANVLAELHARYRFILVDEYQDTNLMQARLVNLLAGKRQNVMVVGDDDQSIYGWRGATLANILAFQQQYPSAKEVTLTRNYRSTQPILDAAYRLIQHNNPERLEVIHKLDKHLTAETSGGEVPRVLHFAHRNAECAWVASDIARRLESGQDPASMAVLARRNNGVQIMHETLELHGIEHAVAGLRSNMYDQLAVKQLIEALKCVSDDHDDMALFHCLSGPIFELDPLVLSAASAQARNEHDSLRNMLVSLHNEHIDKALGQLHEWRQQIGEITVGELAYKIITETGWKDRLYALGQKDPAAENQLHALVAFFGSLREFERAADVASVQNYIRNVPMLRAAGSGFEDASLDISASLVNVLSIHRAKGLEWDTVYITDCTEGSLPMRSFGGGLRVPADLHEHPTRADDHMSEERRLMYVAATRAKKELVLTYADVHGSGAKRKASRFLGEMLCDNADHISLDEAQTSLELFAPKRPTGAFTLPPDILQDGKLSLSVSQVDCWLRCPEDFYYLYVLKMPQPADPALAYGTAIHAAIEKIHEGRRRGETVALQELQDMVQATLPKAGYVSKRSRERAHAQALATVLALYKRFNSETPPIATEQPFAVEIPDTPLMLRGRIDAVYQLPTGVEIRDYKTGMSVTSADKAKQRATSSNQLALYALAWQIMHDEIPALLSLDFVETGHIGSVRKQAKTLESLTAKLQKLPTQLSNAAFEPGGDHTFCSHP